MYSRGTGWREIMCLQVIILIVFTVQHLKGPKGLCFASTLQQKGRKTQRRWRQTKWGRIECLWQPLARPKVCFPILQLEGRVCPGHCFDSISPGTKENQEQQPKPHDPGPCAPCSCAHSTAVSLSRRTSINWAFVRLLGTSTWTWTAHSATCRRQLPPVDRPSLPPPSPRFRPHVHLCVSYISGFACDLIWLKVCGQTRHPSPRRQSQKAPPNNWWKWQPAKIGKTKELVSSLNILMI